MSLNARIASDGRQRLPVRFGQALVAGSWLTRHHAGSKGWTGQLHALRAFFIGIWSVIGAIATWRIIRQIVVIHSVGSSTTQEIVMEEPYATETCTTKIRT